MGHLGESPWHDYEDVAGGGQARYVSRDDVAGAAVSVPGYASYLLRVDEVECESDDDSQSGLESENVPEDDDWSLERKNPMIVALDRSGHDPETWMDQSARHL